MMIKKLRILVIAVFGAAGFYCILKHFFGTTNSEIELSFDFPARKDGARFEEINFRLVTAFSSDHLREALRSCYVIGTLDETQHWNTGFMIAYLLGDLTKDEILQYQKVCPFVELRDFPFENYPKFVRNLKEYRWKPLIVEEILKEFKNIFWFDTSVVFRNLSKNPIKALIKEQQSKYTKCGFRQFDKTGHSIFSATNPKMFTFFDFTEKMAKKNEMYGATLFTVTKTSKSKEIIDKWSKCAIEEECMAPLISFLFCNPGKLKTGEFADCHRFDQSALAILLAQCSDKQDDYYGNSSAVVVQRF